MAGAQRRKRRPRAASRAPSYFRRKASSARAKPKKSRRRGASRAAALKKASKIARRGAKRMAKAPKKSVSYSARRPSAAPRRARSSQISRYFLSSDLLGAKVPAVAITKRMEFTKQVKLSKALNSGLKGSGRRSRLSRFEVLKRNLMVILRRLLAWFSAHSKGMNMTVAGRRALAQLGDLYDLLLLEAADDETLLHLKVAYGEACYYVTQASRGYYKKHSGRGRENYRPYFDRFVESSYG